MLKDKGICMYDHSVEDIVLFLGNLLSMVSFLSSKTLLIVLIKFSTLKDSLFSLL